MVHLDEQRIVALAAFFAIAGTFLLFLEIPTVTTVGRALIEAENTLVRLEGYAANVTQQKFLLCQKTLCITVQARGSVAGKLVGEGQNVVVVGKIKNYRGAKYVEAQKIQLSD
ncbi:MAG: hypothetical protein N3G80_00405 [Candidatus Micrarchaeota archaeon]|nr:hypothetical protein [Candidatus Micrarchaeota archaeon]